LYRAGRILMPRLTQSPNVGSHAVATLRQYKFYNDYRLIFVN